MTDASIVLGIDGRPAQQGAAVVKGALNEVKGTAQQSKKAVDANTKAFEDLKKQTFGLTGALKGLIAGFGLRELLRYSDAWKSLEGRLTIVTRSTEELRAVQQKLFDVAQRTRTSFEATGNLYVKLAQSSRTLGKTQEEMLRFVELVNKGFVISGASASETASAVRQLSQAMASGVLRGDEFNSIMENAPRLQQALSLSLGVSIGKLRTMAEQGQLTAKTVFEGISKQGEAFDREFAKMPVTVGQALQQVDNAFLKFIGQNSAVAKGTSSLALALSGIAENFNLVGKAMILAGGIYASRLIPIIYAGIKAWTTNALAIVQYNALLATAVLRMEGATGAFFLMRTALSAALPVIGLMAAAILLFGDEIDSAAANGNRFAGALKVIKDAMVDFANYAGDKFLTVIDNVSKGLAWTSEHLGLMEAGTTEVLVNTIEARKKALNDALKDDKPGDYAPGKPDPIKAKETALGKLNEKLRESLELAKADTAASKISNRERAIAKALVEGESAAREDVNKGLRSSKMLRTDEIELIKKMAGETFDLTDALDKEADLRAKLKEIVEDTRTPAEKLKKEMEELDKLRPLAKTPEDFEAIKRKAQELVDEVNPMAEIFKNTAESIRDGFKSSIRDTLDGPGGFKNMKDRILDMFKDMLADMITLAIANPIIIPVVQSLGGVLGLSDSSVNAVTGQLGGGGGNNILSSAGNLVPNGLKKNILSALGFGESAATLAALGGATAAGGIATAGALSAGGLAATSVGGVAGAASLSAASIASFALPVAGLVLGGLSLFGGLGGLFGGKPSNKTQSVGLDLATGGTKYLPEYSLSGKKFSQENLDAANQLAAVAMQLKDLISGPDGLTGSIRFFVGNRDGSGFQVNGESPQSFGDQPSLIKGLVTAIMEGTTGLSENLKTAFEHIDFSKATDNLQSIFDDIAFAMNFDKIGDAPEEISQVKTALDALKDSFETYRKTAERLGLSVEKVNDAEQKRLQMMRTAFNDSIKNQILGASAPLTLLINQEDERYKKELEDAKLLGADLEQVSMLHRLNVELIKEQSRESSAAYQSLVKQQNEAQELVNSYSQISTNLGNLMRDLKLGPLSNMSPGAKYSLAKANFLDASGRAAMGDREAAGQLAGLAQTFLQFSRDSFKTSQAFDKDFDLVQSSLQKAKETADRQVSIQQSLLDTATAQLETTKSSFDKMISIMTGNPLSVVGLKENPNDTLLRSMNTRDGQTFFGNVPMSAVDAIFARNGVNVQPGEGRRAQFLNTHAAIALAVANDFRAAGIPGFANGGEFTVGGRGGVDKNYVSFMATRGENVTVTRPGQSANDNQLKAVQKQLEILTNVVAAGMGATNKKLSAVVRHSSEMAGNQRLAAN